MFTALFVANKALPPMAISEKKLGFETAGETSNGNLNDVEDNFLLTVA